MSWSTASKPRCRKWFHLLFEPSDNSLSFLFAAEAFFTIDHKDKSYRIQSYDELNALASQKASEIANSQASTSSGTDVTLKLTEEADTISGLRARKIMKMTGGKPEAEIWVSIDLLPAKLRAAGERIRSVLPEDYWGKVHGNPGLVEIIMLFGIPLKIANNGHSLYQARVLAGSSSNSSFQVPSGYRKLGK